MSHQYRIFLPKYVICAWQIVLLINGTESVSFVVFQTL